MSDIVKRENTAVSFTLDDIKQMAQIIVDSRMFPDINSVEKATTLMLICDSEGLHPMNAVRQYHIIKGRPSMKADTMLARFQQAGGKWKWVEVSANVAKAVAIYDGCETEVSYTIQDAKRAGLDTSFNYRKQPSVMLSKRCISKGIRLAAPGVILGIYTPEELEEIPAVNGHVTIIPDRPKVQKLKPAEKEYEVIDAEPVEEVIEDVFPGAEIVEVETEPTPAPAVEKPKEDKDQMLRKRLGVMIMEQVKENFPDIADDDKAVKAKCKESLCNYTTFTGKDGKEVKGVKTLGWLKGKRLQYTYNTVKKDYLETHDNVPWEKE